MNEERWLTSEDPRKMLEWARRTTTDRKFRLFACAFWQAHTMRDDHKKGVIEPAMTRALQFAESWAESGVRPPGFPTGISGWHPLLALNAIDAAGWTIRGSPTFGRGWIGETTHEQQIALLREIFGNPFRLAAVDPAWLEWNGGTVSKLAQTNYEDRRWDLMPILGDALEDALCDNAEMLAHCRGPGPHVRGCWVVDLILGKE